MAPKTIFMTGISSGIGFGAAQFFLKQGHIVIGTGRSKDAFKEFGKDLNFKGLILDLKDNNQINDVRSALSEMQISKIDVLINNAGVAMAGPFVDQPFSEIEEILQVNVLSLIRLTQNLMPLIAQPGGRIINLSSVAGENGTPFLSAYCASKHAVEGFSEAIRREFHLIGIKVILIGPGSIRTPIWYKGFESLKVRYEKSKFSKSFSRFIRFAADEEKNGLPVADVVRDLEHAALFDDPKIRYAPVPRKFRNYYLAKLIPKKSIDQIMVNLLGLKESS